MPATDACLPNASYRNEPTATLAPHLQVAEAMAIASPPCSPPPTGRKSISWPILGALLRAAACSTIRLPPHLGHTGRSCKPAILADQGRPSRAASGQQSALVRVRKAADGRWSIVIPTVRTYRPEAGRSPRSITLFCHRLCLPAQPVQTGEGRARTRESPGVS